jgi:hypothetical protein
MAEYEALIFGLSAALSLGIRQLLVKGDSQLIIKQVHKECSCNEPRLAAYLLHVRKLEKDFIALELQHVPRANNLVADELSMRPSTWAPVLEGVFKRRLLRPTAQPAESGEGGETSTSKLAVPVAFHLQHPPRIMCAIEGPANLLAPQPVSQSGPDAWISEIRDYLKENILLEDHVSAERIVQLAKRYTVVEGNLYRRGANNILMWCITQEEGRELLAKIHGGECRSHSSSRTLVRKAFRHGFYWPTALQDVAELVKSCKACQFHAKQIHTPAQALQMIPPSWPFAIWGWISWDHFPGLSVGTIFSSSPSTNSQSGRRPPLWSVSPKVLLLPSSSRLFADLGSQAVSLRTTGPSSKVGSSKSIARASAPSFALRLWLIPGATAGLRGQTQKSSGDSRHAPMIASKSMVQIGSTNSRPYYGGTGPHLTELPGRPRSSWSTGPKPAFPRKSLWAPHESSLLMSLCRNSYDVRTWTSSTSADGKRRSEMHGTTKRSGATTNSLCIVGSSGSVT